MRNLKIVAAILMAAVLFTGCTEKPEKKHKTRRTVRTEPTFNYEGESRGTMLDNSEEGIQNMFRGGDMPTSIRYTVRDYESVVTYIISDPELISDLMDAIEEVTVREFDTEQAVLAWDSIYFCGLYPDTAGGSTTYEMRLKSGIYDSANGWLCINYCEDFSNVLQRIMSEGMCVSYDDVTLEAFEDINGSYGNRNEDMEVGIFESRDGYFGINIWTDGNDLFDGNTSIIITSIEISGSGYLVHGLVGDEEVSYNVSQSNGRLCFEGHTIEGNVIE